MIDLRSDTLTRPDEDMRAAMAAGDRAAADIYARLLRRDFPNDQAAQALPQLLQATPPPAPKQP